MRKYARYPPTMYIEAWARLSIPSILKRNANPIDTSIYTDANINTLMMV
jgi:hypothetical protein